MAGLLNSTSKVASEKVKVNESSKVKVEESSEVKVIRLPMETRGIFPKPHRYTYRHEKDASRRLIVLLYARLGLHCYNLLRGKDLKLSSIKQYTKSYYSAASAYNITLKAKDPAETSGSLLTFEAQVNEKNYGGFVLELPSSGPRGEPNQCLTVRRSCLSGYPRPELPPDKNPFEDDPDRFRVLKTSEVRKNDWIRLYLELAVATTNRHCIENGLPKFKILNVAMEITRDLEPFHKGLDAYDATFYIRYMDSCKSRVGDDVDRVAIVRRFLDVHSEVFKIMGSTQSSQTITPASNGSAAIMEAASSSAQD